MLIREDKKKLTIPKGVIEYYSLKDLYFYDIETTGFSKDEDKIVLISLGYFLNDSEFFIKQYFAEGLSDEKSILCEFIKDCSSYKRCCSFNGLAFDEPFIYKRTQLNHMNFKLPEEHIDLYRKIRPYHKGLGIKGCSLKSVETFLGIKRNDCIDGKQSVELYYKYLESKDDKIKEQLMLHNYEDVLNLPPIFNLIYKIDTDKSIIPQNCINKRELKYLLKLLNNNNIYIDKDLSRISKNAGRRIIDCIVKGSKEKEEILYIINNSY